MNGTETLCHERDSKIDILRTLCNLMIVVWHAWAVYRFCPKITSEFYFWKGICGLMTITMPAFFFLSGYLLMRNLSNSTVKAKIWHRIKRLLVPYVCWNVCFIAFLLAVSFWNRGFLLNFFGNWHFDSWPQISLMVFGLIRAPADTPLWFLRALFIYSIAGIPFLLAIRTKWGRTIVIIVCVSWMVVAEKYGIEHGIEYAYPSYSIFIFLLGALFMQRGIRPFDFFDRPLFWLCGLIGGVGMALYTLKFKEFMWMKNVSFILELPLMFAIVNRLGKYLNYRRWFVVANDASFFIYCSHWLICPLILSFFYPLMDGVTGCLTFSILIFIGLGIPVMVVSRMIMFKLFPKWFSMLMDGRL